MDRDIKHKCGIFGIFKIGDSGKDIITETINGLDSLQHRGRESGGISYVNNKNELVVYKNIGLIKEIFKDKQFPDGSNTISCIGHTRYSTTGKKNYKTLEDRLRTVQPLLGEIALVHNGNIPNVSKIELKLGLSLKTDSDSEIFIQYINKLGDGLTFEEKLIEIVNNIPGVYSLIIQTTNALYAIKDRYGVHPLCLAMKDSKYCLSSESTYIANCDFVREINAGEILKIDKNGLTSIYQHDSSLTAPAFCLFELIYFMRHTSIMYDERIDTYRYKFGYKLGEIEQIDFCKDMVVVAIPNTAIPSAKGYAAATGLNYVSLFEKRKGTGRTFILPTNTQRYNTNRVGLKIKDDVDITGLKSVILVDDSLVRGNTIRTIIEKIKEFGVEEIHLRIPSPPIKSQCYYGIDIPTKEELIANGRTESEIATVLEINSVKYLDYEIMSKMFNGTVCGCCFTGKYDKSLLDF